MNIIIKWKENLKNNKYINYLHEIVNSRNIDK